MLLLLWWTLLLRLMLHGLRLSLLLLLLGKPDRLFERLHFVVRLKLAREIDLEAPVPINS